MNRDLIKIVIVNHALTTPVFQNRWKKLAEDQNFEVHLVIPELWVQNYFAEEVIYRVTEKHEDDFHIHPLPTTTSTNPGTYLFKSVDVKLKEIKPDLIYIIGNEGILIFYQIFIAKYFFAKKAKIIFFTMNAKGVPYKRATRKIGKIYHKFRWNRICNNTDAALVHYPGCKESLKKGGYKKPIYLQTQVGVDETLFRPNPQARNRVREQLKFKDCFVIGYLGRLIPEKGVEDIANTFIELIKEKENIALLLIGNGTLREKLEHLFKKEEVENRVRITGFVDQGDVPDYLNALDTLVIGSKTTKNWIDTFPLATVQAQATGIPVIASDSASLPWQLSDSAKLFKESNTEELREALLDFIRNKEERLEFARKGRERSLKYFCHSGMTENFKKIVYQVLSGQFVFHENEEKYKQWKAY